MPTVHLDIDIAAPAERVWALVRTIDALPRMVPGFVTATHVEPNSSPPLRVVTFASGAVLRERIVTNDDALRRLVWSIEDDMVAHHNGAMTVEADGAGSRVTWTADVLPDALAEVYAPLMRQGLATMKATIEAAPTDR